jgi:sugar phosphate isomerase/epimerase
VTIKDRLSIQLYSARKFRPLDDQLRTIARIGYRQVEPYPELLGEIDELARSLRKHGHAAPSCLVDIDMLRRGIDAVAAALRLLGTRLIGIPFLDPAERPKDREGWRAVGRDISGIRKAVGRLGFGLAWHNHEFELMPLEDGTTPLDILLETDPELTWEADIGWVTRANADPLTWVDKYRDRIAAFHIKDVAAPGAAPGEDGWADVGTGTIDWQRLLSAMNRSAAGLFVVEHDNPSDFARFARHSYDIVASW